MQKTSNVLYAVYPNANGFGFVYMDSPRTLLDFGVVRINPISNSKVLERIKKSLDYFRPTIVILLDPEGKSSRTGKRVRKLINLIVAYAEGEKLPVVQYSRDQIKEVFEQFGATTKYEISQVILKEFKELEPRAPKRRLLWTSEHHHMATYDALSLALTWFYLNE